jgi:hypothetical protein
MQNRFCTACVIVVVATVFGFSGQLAIQAQGNLENPGVVSPKAKFEGKSYSQWQRSYEEWIDSIPASVTPLNPGGDALQNQVGNVWFLSGTGSFTPEVRDIAIPAGTALFFPILAAECSTVEGPPFHGDSEAELRACAKFLMDHAVSMSATIDGVLVHNLAAYRRQSAVTSFTLPDDNIFGVPGGTSGHSVDDGVFLLVKPLPVGSHTIHFEGVFDVTDLFGIVLVQDTTYNIAVTP